MTVGTLLLRQISIMAILVVIGYIISWKGLVTYQGSKDIGKILQFIVLPLIVIRNFNVARTPEMNHLLLESLLIASITISVSILIARLVYPKDRVSQFSSAFCNTGGLAVPLISALFGNDQIIYITMLLVLVIVLQWTYGIVLMTGDTKAMQPKEIIKNPIVIAMVIGILVYFIQIKFPPLMEETISHITALNTPVGMFLCGIYLQQNDLLKVLKDKSVYTVSFVRLVLIPLVVILLFKFLPFGSYTLKMYHIIAISVAVGGNVAYIAQIYEKDYGKAVGQYCISTILCLITLPLIVTLAEYIL